jgi:hypothetical protein
MQTMSREMPWSPILRGVAMVLAVVLGLEWTAPLSGFAQLNQTPASISATTMGNQELPPMQEAESIEQHKPFYKTWWFWTIVGVVLVGGGAAAALGGGGGNTASSSPGGNGTVTVNGPAPR